MNGKHIHILGVCGTAMAAIASLAKSCGYRVTGSDAGVYPPMSDYLAELGVAIAPFDIANLEPAPDLCVVGNAMGRGNVEVEAILERGLAYCSGPEFVGNHILPGRHAVVVAGTHGKTTCASLMAHMLEVANRKPGFLIGGVPENFGGGARRGEGEPFVLEGDEYDTAFFDKRSKFLHYHARTLILNNLEYDHADIFPNLEAIKTQFHHLIRTVPANGTIIANADEEHVTDVLSRGCWTPVVLFGRYPNAHTRWQWEALSEDGAAFRIYRDNKIWLEAEWEMIGIHNAANACAVAVAASSMGVSREDIAAAYESFAGIRRRMTLVGEAGGIKVFDDFAHHPTAITNMVAAAKASMRRGGSKGELWVIVEPRSNTMRTRIHQERLPLCFAAADHVLLAEPSRRNLQDHEVLDAGAVCAAIGSHAWLLPDADTIVAQVRERAKAGDHLLVLSNGGFDGIHGKLLKALA
ncbi:UDP-N-acetylmuramate: L-alanyl-gamma-D-glutamyl-meso-diaminopimelate ligase [Mariprofundus ferrinatatus]|uniref:UDP-N-acetylmuramate: L-alanyl-gamma-D-glutamyl-meso-diaminopimelate ligase n=1 Tax=Mariprofundus ferrinatatus TaxID=1921087 RepID=A0A2K8L5T5_9PROT|nr:UDP-N-acetylmuramate:L-alanyl-gamma-D-glutamyl-meso-diaminopimelate ligase [Mariprofundus ferrinatatus]ATX82678.1 UDP-N-acetylmuramate: L-alanyl-gamma-D-glutamyl-meso-diaminopimelate ligase [Mariprofundus ferrinatatus]